jgi:hypothetical protein
MTNKEINAQDTTHRLTYILTTGQASASVLFAAALSIQSSPTIHQSSVAIFYRGSRETRASSNHMLRAAGGREVEPAKSDTPRCHPMVMLTQTMVAAAARHHRIDNGKRIFWLGKVGKLLRLLIDTKDGDSECASAGVTRQGGNKLGVVRGRLHRANVGRRVIYAWKHRGLGLHITLHCRTHLSKASRTLIQVRSYESQSSSK